jgi:RNA polymerase sigma-70 factor (ECF subfamily)
MNQETGRTDDELVELARAGRSDGFEGLYMRHAKRVYNLAKRMLGDDAVAEDVTQDVFMQVFRAIDRFRGASEFTTWLHRITHNTCINRLRAARVRTAASLDTETAAVPPSDEPNAEEILRRDDLQHEIQRALERMEPEHRAILLLRVIENKSYADIAALTDQSEDQVRGKLYRARKAFIQHFRP